MTQIDRGFAAALGREAVHIIGNRAYRSAHGLRVEIGDALDRAVAGTCDYPPTRVLPATRPGGHDTHFAVRNETTLAAARRLVEQGGRPAALNFASATSPGGGFLRGARAQEESLARSSGLHACLVDRPMYLHHRALNDPLYTSWVMYSPAVPVFRNDDGVLLDLPWSCAFITAPAPKAKALAAGRRGEIERALDERICRVLTVAAAHGHDSLVLGAWGCGAFGNDPVMVAGQFHTAFTGNFAGTFARVVFAIVDWSDERRYIGPFAARFGAHDS